MTRYTINIGDDFPIGDDDEPKPGEPHARRRGPRFWTIVRVLFAVSLIGIVVHHPFQIALITGLVLLVRRHPRFLELRSRLRGMGSMRDEWRRHRAERHEHRHDHRRDNGGRPGHGPRPDKRDDRGYGAFV